MKHSEQSHDGIVSKTTPLTDVSRILSMALQIVSNMEAYVKAATSAYPSLNPEQVVDKLTAESLLLLMLAHRSPSASKLADKIQEAARILAMHGRQSRHLRLLAASPQSALGVGFAHVMLRELGLDDVAFDQAITQALASPYLNSVDRPNFRQMEVRWLKSVATRTAPLLDDLVETSVLSVPCHPIFMRREDAYAITHAAMYVTDFGRKEFPPRLLDDVRAFVEHAISWTLPCKDWDLLGEVMIVHRLARLPSSVYVRCAEAKLADLFGSGCWIPGPNYSDDAVSEADAFHVEAYRAMHGYHSTFVYGIVRLLEMERSEPSPEVVHFANLRRVEDQEHDRPIAEVTWGVDPTMQEAIVNARLIWLARKGMYGRLLEEATIHETSQDIRVRQTCSVAAELLSQWVRAQALGARELNLTRTCGRSG